MHCRVPVSSSSAGAAPRPHGRNIGSWETVHGTIEPGETPVQASLRELREETGLVPENSTISAAPKRFISTRLTSWY